MGWKKRRDHAKPGIGKHAAKAIEPRIIRAEKMEPGRDQVGAETGGRRLVDVGLEARRLLAKDPACPLHAGRAVRFRPRTKPSHEL